eukprot:873794-Amphidinium_carterae.2
MLVLNGRCACLLKKSRSDVVLLQAISGKDDIIRCTLYYEFTPKSKVVEVSALPRDAGSGWDVQLAVCGFRSVHGTPKKGTGSTRTHRHTDTETHRHTQTQKQKQIPGVGIPMTCSNCNKLLSH